jgi:predicted NAD/FAD-binding protein
MGGMRRDVRVGIVGAGAAGLAVADALRKAGVSQVTVLEKSERVGGKCFTLRDAGRAYELGAGAITSAYQRVGALCAEHGLTPRAGMGGLFLDEAGKRLGWLPPTREGGLLGIGWHGAKLVATLARLSRLRQPGFAGLGPELAAPFLTWARRSGVERTVPFIEPWVTGFGYGPLDEIPAAYVLKYLLVDFSSFSGMMPCPRRRPPRR